MEIGKHFIPSLYWRKAALKINDCVEIVEDLISKLHL